MYTIRCAFTVVKNMYICSMEFSSYIVTCSYHKLTIVVLNYSPVGTWNLPPSFLSQVSLFDSILIVIGDQ